MHNSIAKTIYGQRFLVENQEPYSARDENPEWLLPQFELTPAFDVLFLREKVKELRQDREKCRIIPLLNISLEILDEGDTLSGTMAIIRELEIPTIGLCIDEGSGAFKFLSPRMNSLSTQEAVISKLCSLVSTIASYDANCLVAMNAEEICPGGLDPQDAINMAKRLIQSGVTSLIASSGTEDFPILKHRRYTKRKDSDQSFSFDWPEPFLASACWLKELGVPVFAQGCLKNPQESMKWAAKSGLKGVIDYRSNIHQPL